MTSSRQCWVCKDYVPHRMHVLYDRELFGEVIAQCVWYEMENHLCPGRPLTPEEFWTSAA